MKKNNNIEPVIIKDYYKNHKRSKTRDINKLKIVYSIIAIIIIFIIAIYALTFLILEKPRYTRMTAERLANMVIPNCKNR